MAISASRAIVLDVRTGVALVAKDADAAADPSGIVKLMTLAVVADALKAGQITLDTEYTVSVEAWRKAGPPAGSVSMFAAPKSRIKVSDLLRGLMVQAANDACLILAEGLAGSEDAFVARMNEKAKALGLAHTLFATATGFADPRQTTTARDLATLMAYVATIDPALYAIYGEKDFLWNKVRQRNRNPLLASVPGVDGAATGASDDAGFGIAATAKRGERRVVVVLLGAKSARERTDEARRLFEWSFSAFALKRVFEAGATVGNVSVFGGRAPGVDVKVADALWLPVATDGKDAVSGRIAYSGPVAAPVTAGSVVAHLEIVRDGAVALTVPLLAAVDVPRGTLMGRAWEALYEIGVGLMGTGAKP